MGDTKNQFFIGKPREVDLRVLTITATFPSLIQPWLINQLVQIIKNGGENRILARQSESGTYNTNIRTYRLDQCFEVIPDGKLELITKDIRIFFSLPGFISIIRGLSRLPTLLVSGDYTVKEKLLGALMIPFMGIKDVDIIHSHSEMAGNRFLPVVEVLNKPMVITFHGLPPMGVKPITREQRARYVKKAGIILVNTEFARKQFISLGGDASKIHILPQGIELEKFPFHAHPFPEKGPINVLTVGRFHPDKGQKYAIAAIASLIKEGYSIKYRLVGNGPELNNLQKLGDELGIGDHLEFLSRVSDEKLQNIYDNSHIFILPSLKDKDGLHEETQGVVLQEAQASGLITIATRVGGIPECIDDGVSGFLVDDRSDEAIKHQLADIIKMSEKWPAIQLKARQWVEERYSIEVIGKRIKELYQSLL